MKTLDEAMAEVRPGYPIPFLSLMRFVLSHEDVFQKGHYGDYDSIAVEHDPDDPGGTTKYGIDQEDHPNVEVENLSMDDAIAIYHSEIWNAVRADELPGETALVLCDSCINCGTPRASRWLQHLVGAKEDGNIGQHTIDTVTSFVTTSTDGALAQALIDRREYYYTDEVRGSLREKYLKGWNNRLADLHTSIDSVATSAVA